MPRHIPTSKSRPAAGGEGLALTQVVGVLRRSWVWIALPTLAAAIGAGVFVQAVTPRYTGEAKVLLESRDPAFARSASERNEPIQAIDEQAVASQVQVAMSRDIARQAIRALGLVGREEFDPTLGETGPLRQAMILLGLSRDPPAGAPEDRALDAYLERLLVYPVGKSRILAFEFRSRDPELAAKAANTVAELYIASLAAAQVDTARYASTWLGSNIEALRARVAEAEARVEAFRAKNGLFGAGGANQPLGAQQLGELSSQLSQARTIRADLVGRVKVLKDMIKEGRAFEIPDVANNELIRRTVESRMTLRAQLALESRTLLPAHPRIKELTAQVTDLETQIKAAAERIVRTLENDAKIAGARVESLQAAVDGQSAVVVKGNGSEIELRALEREAKVQREQLESYLSRYREAAARDGESASPADARIVSRAAVPDQPSFPKKVPTFAVATLLAFLLAAGAVVGRHLLTTPPAPHREPRRDLDEDASEDAREAGPGVAAPERLFYPEPLPPRAPSVASRFDADEDADDAALPESERPASEPDWAADAACAALPDPHATDAAETADHAVAEADASSEAAAGEGAYDLDALVARLETGPHHGGRSVLVVETAARRHGEPGLAAGLAHRLAAEARTLGVAVNGPDLAAGEGDAAERLGLTDLVAGEAAFPEAIRAIPDARLHVVAPGLTETEVLLDEPQGLAIGLNAMAQAYQWVVCRIDAFDEDDLAASLVSAVAASMDAVVIASEAREDEPALVALYERAEASGAGQVLIARETGIARRHGFAEKEMRLRLSAA